MHRYLGSAGTTQNGAATPPMTVAAIRSPSNQFTSAARADCKDAANCSGIRGPPEPSPTFTDLLDLELPIRLRGKKIARLHEGGMLAKLDFHGSGAQLVELDFLHELPTLEIGARFFGTHLAHAGSHYALGAADYAQCRVRAKLLRVEVEFSSP